MVNWSWPKKGPTKARPLEFKIFHKYYKLKRQIPIHPLRSPILPFRSLPFIQCSFVLSIYSALIKMNNEIILNPQHKTKHKYIAPKKKALHRFQSFRRFPVAWITIKTENKKAATISQNTIWCVANGSKCVNWTLIALPPSTLCHTNTAGWHGGWKDIDRICTQWIYSYRYR